MNYHAPGDGNLFAPTALCGTVPADEPDRVLRMHSPGVEVTCADCRTMLLAALS